MNATARFKKKKKVNKQINLLFHFPLKKNPTTTAGDVIQSKTVVTRIPKSVKYFSCDYIRYFSKNGVCVLRSFSFGKQ